MEGEGMTEEILGEALAPGPIVGGDGFFAAVVDVEAGVFPGEQVGEFAGADELGFAESVEEAVAEEFDGRVEVFGGHAVEMAVGGEEAVGGEDVEVRVEDQIVAEGVDGGDGSEFAIGEIEAGAEDNLESSCRGVEEMGKQLAALAEDAAQDAGDGEDELAVQRGPYAGEGGQVDHGVEALVGQHALADVAVVEPDTFRQWLLGRDHVEGGDQVPGDVELSDDVGADEAGRAGDEHGKELRIHARWRESTGCKIVFVGPPQPGGVEAEPLFKRRPFLTDRIEFQELARRAQGPGDSDMPLQHLHDTKV
jgi:hypothetical protein